MQAWPSSVKTYLRVPLYHSPKSLTFGGAESFPYGKARIVDKDMQDAVEGIPADDRLRGRISIQGIDAVLFPENLTALVPTKLLKNFTYGTDPPLPTVKISKFPLLPPPPPQSPLRPSDHTLWWPPWAFGRPSLVPRHRGENVTCPFHSAYALDSLTDASSTTAGRRYV